MILYVHRHLIDATSSLVTLILTRASTLLMPQQAYLAARSELERVWREHGQNESKYGGLSTFYDQYFLPRIQNLTGMHICRSPMPIASTPVPGKHKAITLSTFRPLRGKIHYTTNGSAVTEKSLVYSGATIQLPTGAVLRAVAFEPGLTRSRELKVKTDDTSTVAVARRVPSVRYLPVCVAADASPVELFAAKELRDYLGNMSAVHVHLYISDTWDPSGDVIAVGFGAAIALGLAQSELRGLRCIPHLVRANWHPAGLVRSHRRQSRNARLSLWSVRVSATARLHVPRPRFHDGRGAATDPRPSPLR